jgi:hypothetical protein
LMIVTNFLLITGTKGIKAAAVTGFITNKALNLSLL